jgi:hypothetical protein
MPLLKIYVRYILQNTTFKISYGYVQHILQNMDLWNILFPWRSSFVVQFILIINKLR